MPNLLQEAGNPPSSVLQLSATDTKNKSSSVLPCSTHRDADILDPWDKLIKTYDAKTASESRWQLCSSCVKALCERETSTREQMWSELPGLLCLNEDSADDNDAEESGSDVEID